MNRPHRFHVAAQQIEAAIDGDPQALLLRPVDVAVTFRDQLRDTARVPQPQHRPDRAEARLSLEGFEMGSRVRDGVTSPLGCRR
jgi:hypothetical protein